LKGFSPKWIEWIKSFNSGRSVVVHVNDEVGPFFQTKKGLRQGDPLSPILLNIVTDMPALFINRAKADDQLSGVVPHLIDDGLYPYYNTLMIRSSLWTITCSMLIT